MRRWQQIEQQEKETVKAMKKCDIFRKYMGFGFEKPVVSGMGKCSGCYNPDDGELESLCSACQHNEYYIESEVGTG